MIHGAPCRFTDPARFSLAHGGKDGHPFPVPLRVYDRTLQVLRHAVDRARLGNDDRLAAIRQLDAEARRVEAVASGPDVRSFLRDERARSSEYGGRTVFDEPATAPTGSGPPRTAAPAPATAATAVGYRAGAPARRGTTEGPAKAAQLPLFRP